MRNHYVRWLSLLAFLSFVQLALAQNDDCSGAILITPGITSGTTAGATTDTGTPFCGTGVTSPGVWYTFVGNGGTAELDICGGGTWDSKLSAYTGTCGALVCETGNDDNFGVCGSSRSAIEFPTTNGVTYYVLVHGFGGANGAFDLDLSFGPPPPPPPSNDDCSGAQAISIAASGSVNGDVTTATTDNTIDCGASNGSGYGVWYSFVGTGDLLELTTCGGASWDTKIFVFSGSCGALSCVTGDDDADDGCGGGFSLQSKVEFLTNTGTTYYVLVETFSSSTGGVGPFTLSYTVTPVIPPANDDCTNAEPIADGDVKTGDTKFAADESGNPNVGACGGVTYDGAGGVWYVYSGDGDAVTFATCGSSYDTKLSVYQAFPGNCGFLFCVAGGDDECGDDAQVSVNTSMGSDYYVLVHGSGIAARGPYSLVATKGANNDDCSGAIAVSCGDAISGSTIGASGEVVPACPDSYTAPGVWYKIQGTGGPIEVDLSGSAYDTKLFIYEGSCAFGALTCVASDDDGGSTFRASKTGWLSTIGTEYFILVSGFGSDQGLFDLAVSCQTPMPNDFCSTAFPATAGTSTIGNTDNAIEEFAPIPFCGTSYNGGTPAIWYKYTALTSAPTNFSLCNPGTNYDTKISIFSGSCGSLVCAGGNDDLDFPDFPCSEVSVCTNQGETYYILVHGFSGNSGDFELTIEPQTAVANDNCADATPVAIGSTTPGTTIGSCPDDNGFCGTASNGTGAVWYSFVGEGDWMDINTCNAVGFDTRLQIFTGTCGALTCEEGNDDGFDCAFSNFRSKIVFLADEGVTYYVKVFGFSSEGDFELTVDLAPEVNILQEYDLNNPSFVVILNGVPGPSDFVPVSQHDGVNSLLLVRYPSGNGQITGTLAPRGTSLARWDVNIQLRERKNWTDWNGAGGLYKGSSPVAAANHQTWSFSEIAPGSFLSGHPGTGYAGDTLWLAHMPANMLYGMQRGLGANDYNGNFGISGWFTFSGAYSGTGDVNATITNVEACENSAVGCAPAPVSPMIIALEGASDANGMRTTLSNNGVLSQTQPFNNSAYNYSGTESFTGTATNTVDWVLVSLRDPANPRSVVARRAALVGSDGTLMNGDGTTFNLRDLGSLNQYYYISVASNNHVDVMTADAVSLAGAVDFTKGGSMIYTDPSMEGVPYAKLPNGKIGLISGDTNGDGVVDAADIADIQNHFHEAGAKVQDMDYDGLVTPQDLRTMMKNQGAESHVPR